MTEEFEKSREVFPKRLRSAKERFFGPEKILDQYIKLKHRTTS